MIKSSENCILKENQCFNMRLKDFFFVLCIFTFSVTGIRCIRKVLYTFLIKTNWGKMGSYIEVVYKIFRINKCSSVLWIKILYTDLKAWLSSWSIKVKILLYSGFKALDPTSNCRAHTQCTRNVGRKMMELSSVRIFNKQHKMNQPWNQL